MEKASTSTQDGIIAAKKGRAEVRDPKIRALKTGAWVPAPGEDIPVHFGNMVLGSGGMINGPEVKGGGWGASHMGHVKREGRGWGMEGREAGAQVPCRGRRGCLLRSPSAAYATLSDISLLKVQQGICCPETFGEGWGREGAAGYG